MSRYSSCVKERCATQKDASERDAISMIGRLTDKYKKRDPELKHKQKYKNFVLTEMANSQSQREFRECVMKNCDEQAREMAAEMASSVEKHMPACSPPDKKKASNVSKGLRKLVNGKEPVDLLTLAELMQQVGSMDCLVPE